MKKLLVCYILIFFGLANARVIIADINGGGQFTSIQAAINAAITNDTVKVWPGVYVEQISLNKNIRLLGSGYENTIITGNFSPTVSVSSGCIQWFKISSTTANGIHTSGGKLVIVSSLLVLEKAFSA
ncbi:MAG: hypothetical protein HYV28_09770 [Ignavibacteriales bacterium]|nr:hypothetical protein [Ignavibacteriales bacterium]